MKPARPHLPCRLCRLLLITLLGAAACESSGLSDGDAAVPSDGGADTGTGEGPCTLSPQAGCASGQACDLDNRFADGGTACRSAGPGTETSTCTSGTECAAGYGCIGTVPRAACLRYCRADTDCSTPGGLCATNVNNTPGVKVCTANCDPVTSQGCPMTWGCEVFRSMNTVGGTYCTPAGNGGQGAACAGQDQCLAGYACVNQGGTNICQKNCRVGQAGCPGGTACVPYAPPILVGNVQFGVCRQN